MLEQENNIKQIIEIAKEREKYRAYSIELIQAIKKLERDYQKGRIGSVEYEKIRYHYLKGKTLDQKLESLNRYIIKLNDQLKQLHKHIFYEIYKDKIYEKLSINAVPVSGAVSLREIKQKAQVSHPSQLAQLPKKKTFFGELPKKKTFLGKLPKNKTFFGLLKKEKKEPVLIPQGKAPKPLPGQPLAEKVIEKGPEKIIQKDTEIIIQPETKTIIQKEKGYIPKTPENILGELKAQEKADRKKLGLPSDKPIEVMAEQVFVDDTKKQRLTKPSKKTEQEAEKEFFKELYGKSKSKVSNKKHVDILEQLFKTKLEERTFIGEKTKIPKALIELETLKKKAEESEIKFDYKKFIQERESGFFAKLKKKKDVTEIKIKPHPLQRIGAIANITVRPIGNYFIKKFPEFFENLYKGLRLANMPVLSNTYVNIIILATIIATTLFFLFFFLVFMFRGAGLMELIAKSVLTAILGGGATFTALYAYPFMKQDERSKQIRTNLPFAINHMSAIASSGISPVQMFKLIAESSDEYGIVSEELQKITNYVEIFGYDLPTSVETVSSTTSSPELKAFLDGLLSTLSTGGDLGLYLKQKAEESLTAYRLEREQYIETISTYSDVYTGILIAAPLFFISILSLVSILGGQVLGYEITTVMAFGTYIIIPTLNFVFIGFLQLTKVNM